MLDHVKRVAPTCENNCFEEKDLFVISENKNLSQVTSYTVYNVIQVVTIFFIISLVFANILSLSLPRNAAPITSHPVA